jgi:hypothetical protein
MRQDAWREQQIPETIAEICRRGFATPEEFRGMLFEWDKPAGEPCRFQKHRKGCTVYDRRPFGCRYWSCRWLVNDDTADLPRPDRCHYVVDVMPDFVTMTINDEPNAPPVNIEVIQVWVDPKHRDAHRDPRLRAYLERRGNEGKVALIRFNESDGFTLWPPSLTGDGQWHEQHGHSLGRDHAPDERLAGIAIARKSFMPAEPLDGPKP